MSDTAYAFLLALQIMSILILFIEAIYALFQKASIVRTEIMFLLFATIIMMIGYLIEIMAKTQESALIGTAVSYIGKPFVMLCSACLVATYCGYNINRKLLVVLIVYSAIFPILVFTNDLHHLYYATVGFEPQGANFSALVLTHGPTYYFYMVSIFAYTLADIIMAGRELYHCKSRSERIQILLIFAMIIAGIIGYVIYLTGITAGYDSTMMGCVVGTLILFILFFKFKLFDVVTMAKEQALNDASGGILVFDNRKRVIYQNSSATKLLSEVITLDDIIEMPDDNIIKHDENVYQIKKREICSDNRVLGAVVEMGNITDSYSYAERLEKDVQARTDEILHIQRSVIAGIANIVEMRNGETGGHIRRTSTYVGIIALQLRKMGLHADYLNNDSISRLIDAAPLHDLGKIVVSDTILMKPAKLSDVEYEIMKKHSEAGKDIIESVMSGVESEEYVTCAVEMAYGHHEKWDGSGYPQGLKGEEIPLSARIMAVADVYDALRSERCYKKAFSIEESRKIIIDGSGVHFDPDVVRAFMLGIDKIEKVI